ncbi:MAG: LysM domain [Chloroflexota bacterium]|jgi:LysM repeat protein|nr:LysM domain [Chloroflexota bacterium]
MTAVDPEVRALPVAIPADPAVDRMARICPYLAAADGAWRSASVTREHRCGAITPPAPIAAEKQRRLCLTAEHPTCATFEAARAARQHAPERLPTLPRPLARTTPVVLDHGRIAIAVPALRTDRTTGQAVLIVLMALAFAAIVLARVTGGVPASATDASPSPRATAQASAGPSLSASGSPSATGASASATTGSGGSGAPSSPVLSTTYKVKAGDTLIGIAAKFGTTPKAISTLNGITNASNLKVGQVLQIP